MESKMIEDGKSNQFHQHKAILTITCCTAGKIVVHDPEL